VMEHYLDNAATTRVIEPALKKAVYMMTDCYANPSAQHESGRLAAYELKTARERVLRALGFLSGQLIFTSGGTEAINAAILGISRKYGRKNKKIVSTQIEHAATLEALKTLEKDGYEIILIKPDRAGSVDAGEIAAQSKDACLVTVMAVNNETGARLPVKEIKRALTAMKSPALLHTDAVQAFLKTEEPLSALGADLISVSGHKIGAMKGAGALYAAEGIFIPPLFYGGGQEEGARPGTEALPAAASMGEACDFRSMRLNEDLKNLSKLNSYARASLIGKVPGVIINSPQEASPHIINFSLPGAKSEVLLRVLSGRGVYVSAGSACSRGRRSHVLTAMKLDPYLIDSAIRISFCPENTEDDIDALCGGLNDGAILFKR
ncbi:MAG: cysteine desulfurase, partial [Thermodesulfobacteriota bacterium]|nr:cysteine desulfurase [Thermodesulfobacteriota bacterium]